jgi:hypothetical protein
MQVKVQVVIMTDDGQEITQDIACVERQELTPVMLGLSLAEGKAVLQALQEVVVEWQMEAHLRQQRACPQCGKTRRRKGLHHTVFRTVFGVLAVESPRLYHCPCQTPETTTFSPLATLLPERTTPELLFLETKWAALVSYGLTSTLLQDVLPLNEPLHAVTIRNHVLTVAERLEDALGQEQWSFIDSCPAEWAALPMPNSPITVGIDGGEVREPVRRSLERLKWFLWHGNVYQALQVVQSAAMDLEVAVATSGDGTARKLLPNAPAIGQSSRGWPSRLWRHCPLDFNGLVALC